MGRGGRTSIKGEQAVPKKHVKASASFAFKHSVVMCLDAYDIQRVRTDYFPHLSDEGWRKKVPSIYRWRKNKTMIAKAAASATTATKSYIRQVGTATSLTEDTEHRIVKWVNGLRDDGVPVSGALLCLHAVEEASAQGIPRGKFAASPSWVQSFLARHRLSFRSRSGPEPPSASAGVVEAFAANVAALMNSHGVTRLYNADQTAIFYEMLPTKTVDQRGVRTVWVKCGKRAKDRATAMLLADSDGNKYPLLLVMKTRLATAPEMRLENAEKRHGFGKATWAQVARIQRENNVQVYGNPAGWWNAEITVRWLHFHFGDRNPRSSPILLLLDAFSGHWTDEVKAAATSMNIILVPVPKCQTWQCQPAHVSWIKPLKDRLRRRWVEYLREKLSQRDPLTRFVLPPPSRNDVGSWVAEAWSSLSASIIINGFVKCKLRDQPQGESTRGTEPASDATVAELDATDVVAELEAMGEIDYRVQAIDTDMDIVDRNWDNVTEVVIWIVPLI